MRPIDEQLDRSIKNLKKEGINDYVIVAKCPDSDEFRVRYEGSILWGIGAARFLMKSMMDDIGTEKQEEDDDETM